MAQDRERRGFASLDQKQRKAVAALGGAAAHRYGTAHQWTPEAARIAGRKGGLRSQAAKAARRAREQAAEA